MATIYIDNEPYEVRGRAEPAARLPVAGLRPALFLLAPGPALGRRLPPVRGQAVQGRGRHRGPDRHGLHDAGHRRHAHLDRRPRGARLPRQRHRVADAQPPARLPGLRRRRRVPPAGHDGDDRPQLPALPLPQAHPPQPGPRPVHQPRDEPLHPVLPLRALLPRLRRRARPGRVRLARPRLLRPPRGRRRWRASSAATWSRSAPPASSPTRPSSGTTPASGTCRPRRRSACTAAWAATPSPGERYGMLRRIRNRYNREVNGYFLCDRGRFGYEFVNSDAPHPPAARAATSRRARRRRSRRSEALERAAEHAARRARVIGIGSPRASLEANFALRTLVGAEQLLLRAVRARGRTAGLMPGDVHAARAGAHAVAARDAAVPTPSLVLGEDLTTRRRCWRWRCARRVLQEPMPSCRRALHIPAWNDAAVREAIQQEKGPLFIATPDGTASTTWPPPPIACRAGRHRPAGLRRGARARPRRARPSRTAGRGGRSRWPSTIAEALRRRERPLVRLRHELRQRGGHPGRRQRGLGAARHRPAGRGSASPCPSATASGCGLLGGGTLEDALRGAAAGRGRHRRDRLENDLYRRLARRRPMRCFDARDARRSCSTTWRTDDRRAADVVLPAATFAEATARWSTTRAARSASSRSSCRTAPVRESWRWLGELMPARRPRPRRLGQARTT